MSELTPDSIRITQSVAILVDGNNIERSIKEVASDANAMPNFDTLIPRLLDHRGLNRLVYFREGQNISDKLRERLHTNYHGSVRPCHKSADIPLSIKATQLASKVDTIIIMSGDSDFIELVRHLKNEGVRVEIAAVPETTSRLLLEEADYFHPLDKNDWFSLEPKRPVRKKAGKKKAAGKKTAAKPRQDPSPAEQKPPQLAAEQAGPARKKRGGRKRGGKKAAEGKDQRPPAKI